MEPSGPIRQRQAPLCLVYNDFGNPNSEQQVYVNSSSVQQYDVALRTHLSVSAPEFVPCRFVSVPVHVYLYTPEHPNIGRSYIDDFFIQIYCK